MGAKGGDKDPYGYCVDDPVNRLDAWGLEENWWDGPGGRIIRSGMESTATGALEGATAGAVAGGIGAFPGALAGAGLGLPYGLLKGVGNEIVEQYVGGSTGDKARDLSTRYRLRSSTNANALAIKIYL